MTVWRDRRLYGYVALWSAGQGPPLEVGSTPTISTSRPAALTHSPTPGSKKCGVLSKGFLASKSKPVYRSNNLMVETAAYRRMLVRIQLERIRSAPRPYTGSGDKPSFNRRSLWVNLKPCRKRDEADNIRKRTGIIGSNPIVAAVLLFIIRFSIAIRWEGMGHTGRKQNPH